MSDYDIAFPGGNYTFMAPWQAVNSTGLLPNDRTHVFKLTGAARPLKALAIGAFVTVASGIPMNDFGAGPVGVAGTIPMFLQQRGTVGRTPAAWDINVRLGYDLSWRNSLRGRVLLDLLHLGNPREVVR